MDFYGQRFTNGWRGEGCLFEGGFATSDDGDKEDHVLAIHSEFKDFGNAAGICRFAIWGDWIFPFPPDVGNKGEGSLTEVVLSGGIFHSLASCGWAAAAIF